MSSGDSPKGTYASAFGRKPLNLWPKIWTRDGAGVAAVEFALVVPVFCLILAGAADFGGALYAEFSLNGAVSAAANFALYNADDVNSTSGAALASNLANIVASAHSSNYANGTIVVNNGPTATITAGVVTLSGTYTNANVCYCPVKAAVGVTWGASVTCASTCSSGGIAGKFVTIAANRTYTPFFSSYGLIKNGALSASATIEAATQ
jgi:Flp pilus assembly protein TadG